MTNDPFHQIVSVTVPFGKPYSPGEINRIFKSLGATLHYDIYGFDRLDQPPLWQSESYVYTALSFKNKEVDAQEVSDGVELQFPLATIGSEYIEKYADLVERLSSEFSATPHLEGKPTDRNGIISRCESLSSDLMKEWGEEPGSKTLKILIESNYRKN